MLGLENMDHMAEGGLIVILDMVLALLSVVANLIVITSLREWDGLLNVTYSFLVANLCAANLISAVFVKSISVVRNGYAVASNSTNSDVAFCSIQSLGHRSTLAVYPWTLFFMCWILFAHVYTKQFDAGSTESNLDDEVTDEEKENEMDAGMLEKGILGTIWSFCFAFGFIGETCEIRENPFSKQGLISSLVLYVVPVMFGPILAGLVALCCNVSQCEGGGCCCGEDSAQLGHGSPRVQVVHRESSSPVYTESNPGSYSKQESKSFSGNIREASRLSHCMCIFLLTLILTFVMAIGQFVSEILQISLLYYILLKCVVGTVHHLFIPLALLASYRGLRLSAKVVFLRGGTIQNRSKQLALVQVKKELGIIQE